MSFGVDTLGGLSEKLKQLSDDTQNMYEEFLDATNLYKQGKMNEKEYFAKIGDYLVATSAMNFLAIRVIFEIKNALAKGTSIKNPTGGTVEAPPQQAGFGIAVLWALEARPARQLDIRCRRRRQSLHSSLLTSSFPKSQPKTASFVARLYRRPPSSAANVEGRNN